MNKSAARPVSEIPSGSAIRSVPKVPPAVTVVVTAFNAEKHLPECLDALLNQTCRDFFTLVIDDGSTDATADIGTRYAAACPDRVGYLRLPQNTGSPARARNAALDSGRITGEYVLFLDGDDGLEPDLVESLLSAARRQNADLCICRYDRVDGKTGQRLCRELEWLWEPLFLPPDTDWPAYLDGALWNKLIRTRLLKDYRLPDLRIGEDLCATLALLARSVRVAAVPRDLIHYRVWSGSVMARVSPSDAAGLARELLRASAGALPAWQDVYAVVFFLHLGLSLPLRLQDRDRRVCLRTARRVLVRYFGPSPRYLRFFAFARHGLKGLLLWGCYRAFRAGLLSPLIGVYQILAARLGRELRF